jgi:hypothetical protein
MLANSQRQMDIITGHLLNDTLEEDYRFYPFTIAKTYSCESEGLIKLDLTTYAKEILNLSKNKLAKLEKEIEELTDLRDEKISEHVKSTEQTENLAKIINDINQQMQNLRNKIWTEKNLQTIASNYLKEKK